MRAGSDQNTGRDAAVGGPAGRVRTDRTNRQHLLERDGLSSAAAWLQDAYEKIDSLYDVVRFNHQAAQLAEDGVGELVDTGLAAPAVAGELAAQLERGRLTAVMERAFADHPEVAEFDGKCHTHHVIERFRRLTRTCSSTTAHG